MERRLDPLTYGVDPTGATDSSAAMERCFFDAAALRRAVYIPKGRYLLGSSTAPVKVGVPGSDVHVEGEGEGVTVLVLGSMTDVHLTVGSESSLALRDLTIEGPFGSYMSGTPPRPAISLQRGARLTANRVTFRGRAGLTVAGDDFLVEARDCTFSLATWLELDTDEAAGRIHLRNCELRSSAADILRVSDAVSYRLYGCRFEQAGPGCYGIRTRTGSSGRSAEYCLVQASTFSDAVANHVLTNPRIRSVFTACSFRSGNASRAEHGQIPSSSSPGSGNAIWLQGRVTVLGSAFHGADGAQTAIRPAAATTQDQGDAQATLTVMNCSFRGSYATAAVLREAVASASSETPWLIDQCTFDVDEGSGPGVRGSAGPINLSGCELTSPSLSERDETKDLPSSGNHVEVTAGTVRFTRCRVRGRALRLYATEADVAATVDDCFFLDGGTLDVGAIITDATLYLYGEGNHFAAVTVAHPASTVHVGAGRRGNVKGSLRPLASRADDVVATGGEMSFSLSDNLVHASAPDQTPVTHIGIGNDRSIVRCFEGPFYVVTDDDSTTPVTFAEGGTGEGAIAKLINTGASILGSVRTFVADRDLGQWREV